jgi:hypothetical protein
MGDRSTWRPHVSALLGRQRIHGRRPHGARRHYSGDAWLLHRLRHWVSRVRNRAVLRHQLLLRRRWRVAERAKAGSEGDRRGRHRRRHQRRGRSDGTGSRRPVRVRVRRGWAGGRGVWRRGCRGGSGCNRGGGRSGRRRVEIVRQRRHRRHSGRGAAELSRRVRARRGGSWGDWVDGSAGQDTSPTTIPCKLVCRPEPDLPRLMPSTIWG